MAVPVIIIKHGLPIDKEIFAAGIAAVPEGYIMELKKRDNDIVLYFRRPYPDVEDLLDLTVIRCEFPEIKKYEVN